MNKKWSPYILIGILLIILLAVKWFAADDPATIKPKAKNNREVPGAINRNRGFDRRVSYIKYSNHAKCRMQCRKISQSEVEEVMQNGKINYNKSDLQNARCPRYALEAVTDDEQPVRIVFAQCDESTTVVTVIDLETDFECHCPGDDDK